MEFPSRTPPRYRLLASQWIQDRLKQFSSPEWQWIIVPLVIFLITRVGLVLAAYYGHALLASDAPARYVTINPKPAILGLFSKWDSEWYLFVATKGYYFTGQGQSPVAFFPLYPLLMRILSHLLNYNFFLSGLLISNACLLGGLIFLYRMVEEIYSDRSVAGRAVFYFSVFPASVFFSAIYSESLFFFLIIGCVYFARKRKWWVGALFGMFASATRNLGVLVMVWVGWEWLRASGWDYHQPFALPGKAAIRKELAGLFSLFLIPMGLVAYMVYLWRMFGDPLAFIHTQEGWGQAALPGPLQIMLDAFAQYVRNPTDPVLVVEHFSIILFIILLVSLPWVTKRLGLGATLFCLAYVLIPATTRLVSLQRYISLLFPLCIVLAELGKRSWIDHTIRVVFPMLLAVFATVFANWRFFF